RLRWVALVDEGRHMGKHTAVDKRVVVNVDRRPINAGCRGTAVLRPQPDAARGVRRTGNIVKVDEVVGDGDVGGHDRPKLATPELEGIAKAGAGIGMDAGKGVAGDRAADHADLEGGVILVVEVVVGDAQVRAGADVQDGRAHAGRASHRAVEL